MVGNKNTPVASRAVAGSTRQPQYLLIFAAAFLAAALVSAQALIGGARVLFLLPALALVGIAGIAATLAGPRGALDRGCLAATVILVGYLIGRVVCSPSSFYARSDLFSVLSALVALIVTAKLSGSPSILKRLLIFLIICAGAHVIVGLIQFRQANNFMPISFLQRPDYGVRASGFYVCPNHLAGLLEVLGIFAVSLVCWSRSPSWMKLLLGYFAAVCYAGLILTGSRGGYLSALASICLFLVLSLFVVRSMDRTLAFRISVFGAIGFVVFVGGVALFLYRSDYLSDRARKINDPHNLRLDLWQAALEEWKLEPIVGTGSGTYRFYGRQFRTARMQNDPVYVHNDYLHLLCEYGVVGALFFLAFFALHLANGWKNFRSFGPRNVARGSPPLSDRLALNIGALAAVGAYVVHSALDFNLHIPANALLLGVVFGILASSGRRERLDPEALGAQDWITWLTRFGLGAISLFLLISAVRLFPGLYAGERARVALRDEKPTEAIELAREALRHDPADPEVLFTLGRGLEACAAPVEKEPPANSRELYEEAIATFERGRRVVPLEVTFPLELGYAYDQLGRFGEAEWMFGLAKQLDPNSTAVAQLYRAHLEEWSGFNKR